MKKSSLLHLLQVRGAFITTEPSNVDITQAAMSRFGLFSQASLQVNCQIHLFFLLFKFWKERWACTVTLSHGLQYSPVLLHPFFCCCQIGIKYVHLILRFANLPLSEASRLFLLKDTSLGETVPKYSRTAANENSTENGWDFFHVNGWSKF